MIDNIPHVETVGKVSADEFHADIVAAGKPVLLKGQVADWPAVEAARKSDREIVDYVGRFDNGSPVATIVGAADIDGKFFYDDTLRGLNFSRQSERMSTSLRRILDMAGTDRSPSIYIQSAPIEDHIPGFDKENVLDFFDAAVQPRIWIDNRITVQTHYDLRENVACVVAGRRRFTLFPPSQIPNLYPGPFELTLSGPPVSMVKLDDIDFESYPRFDTALQHALVADLGPGDALYIPYFWWHHVRALEDVNVLVNYWWNQTSADLGSPYDAMLHSILAIRDLPERQRRAWKTMFETYVFGEFGDPVEHLPPEVRGPLGKHDAEMRHHMRMLLIASLGKQAGLRGR